MDKSKTILALFRFAKEEFNRDFIENGYIWMNKVSTHREDRLNEARGDDLECATDVIHPTHFQLGLENPKLEPFKFSTHPKPGQSLINNVRFASFDEHKDGNVFCMTAVTEEWLNSNNHFDERLTSLCEGSPSFVVIRQPNITTFLRRVKARIEQDNLYAAGKKVEYYEHTIDQTNLSVFHKPSIFSYQNEYRVFVRYSKSGPYKINIGSIEDIAELYRFETMQDMVLEFGQ